MQIGLIQPESHYRGDDRGAQLLEADLVRASSSSSLLSFTLLPLLVGVGRSSGW